MADTWRPEIYERFARERQRPVEDLIAALEPVPGGTVLDLGCGTGSHTVDLHRRLGAARTVGVDSSAAMLERAPEAAGVTFVHGDLLDAAGPADVVFANASLQWLDDHRAVLPRVASLLGPGGQLAVQVPANQAHPARAAVAAVGRRFGVEQEATVQRSVLDPGTYATILHGAGLDAVDVQLRVYGFELESGAQVVDFLAGSLLTHYRRALDERIYREFEIEARRAVVDVLGEDPYYYAFERILMWARRPAGDRDPR